MRPASIPLPGSDAYDELPQFPKHSVLPFRRTIRRHELRQIVPLAETTIYEMERRGDFPRRFNLTPRCVVWDLAEVEAWVEERKQAPRGGTSKPDVHLRKTRPVKAGSGKE
ncbi:helix-turn-helix transcriptional regulator [Burkholderia orbicola]|uniref:helix-turn-helix transcriptional regulator n=1 Tax=Burkholderia orbicola TaxID=2978683 RepID=UPI002FE02312